MGLQHSTRKRSKFTVLVATFALAGCSNVQNVGGKQFDIPQKNLVAKSSYPFFLVGWPDQDGFIFILNPDDILQRQISVLVSNWVDVCANARGSTAFVNSSVCSKTATDWRKKPLKRAGDETFWTYGVVDPKTNERAIFVSCHKMEVKGHSGLCTATLPFENLVYSIGLSDSDVPNLSRFFDEATILLTKWKV